MYTGFLQYSTYTQYANIYSTVYTIQIYTIQDLYCTEHIMSVMSYNVYNV